LKVELDAHVGKFNNLDNLRKELLEENMRMKSELIQYQRKQDTEEVTNDYYERI
jgi:hypothetical protein